MERKIGEIFEYNGEWYQCIEGYNCKDCDLRNRICHRDTEIFPFNRCAGAYREDKKSVIFKKLEKVGKPYKFDGHLFQSYRTFEVPIFTENYATVRPLGDNSKISIEIKQTKEDMEIHRVVMNIDDRDYLLDRLDAILHDTHCQQYKDEVCEALSKYIITRNTSNLKPFDLNSAKAGKPVCTRDGRKARIICFDVKVINLLLH